METIYLEEFMYYTDQIHYVGYSEEILVSSPEYFLGLYTQFVNEHFSN